MFLALGLARLLALRALAVLRTGGFLMARYGARLRAVGALAVFAATALLLVALLGALGFVGGTVFLLVATAAIGCGDAGDEREYRGNEQYTDGLHGCELGDFG